MSKKIYKRSDENQRYLKIKNNLLKPFTNIKRNIKDKDHIYKKCNIYKQGKNWYCEIDNIKITINSYSYTIITAHIIK